MYSRQKGRHFPIGLGFYKSLNAGVSSLLPLVYSSKPPLTDSFSLYSQALQKNTHDALLENVLMGRTTYYRISDNSKSRLLLIFHFFL